MGFHVDAIYKQGLGSRKYWKNGPLGGTDGHFHGGGRFAPAEKTMLSGIDVISTTLLILYGRLPNPGETFLNQVG